MSDASAVRLIAGLGNPGAKYAGTRHNVGFDTVDLLADRHGCEIKKKKFGALMSECTLERTKLILLKPQRYINCSGDVIAGAAAYFKVAIEDIIVITDDMALEPGRIRIRPKGSSGGHNGLEDIIDKLGTNEFGRIRIGVGKSDRPNAKDYVLSSPLSCEKTLIENAIEKACDAVLCWAGYGVDVAMNKFNIRNNE